MKSLIKLNATKIIVCIISLFISTSQKTFCNSNDKEIEFKEFKGRLLDADTKKPLESVHIYIENTNINTVTNNDGDFLLKVPTNFLDKNVIFSYLGYTSKIVKISDLKIEKNKVYLTANSIKLADVNVNTLKDPKGLVKKVFEKKGDNYIENHSVMKAFYRETIKKRNKNLSLSEAIVNIYKSPYSSDKKDILEFYKTRKSSNYSKQDTLAFKLRGGPFNTLLMDIVKYPQYVFSDKFLDNYTFSFKGTTKKNNTLIYIIQFKAKSESLLYQGELYIDHTNKILTSASYELNLTNKDEARRWFSIEKPAKSKVTPLYAKYNLKYFEKNDKWYHGYSKMALGFKVNWKKRLFNSNYNMVSEMAITNWEEKATKEEITFPQNKDRIKTSIVMTDYSVGFSEENFWGKHNIIEPDKSIERAIKKIQKKLE